MSNSILKGAKRAAQSVTEDFQPLTKEPIEGVIVKDIQHIITRNSVTTEVIRTDWGLGLASIEQCLHVCMRVGAISGWHCHEQQTDHIFCIRGALKLVLYDGREDSPTHGRINEFFLSDRRPQLIVVPPLLWHTLCNVSHDESIFVNFFDRVYQHKDPDEWHLPLDTDQIPYPF